VNPFGISYNPLSLAWNLERLLDDSPFTADDVTCSMGRYFSYKHHSSFTRGDAAETLAAINAAHGRAQRSLAQSKVLFLTLGSAFAWHLKESGMLVANCHKQPAALFEKTLVRVWVCMDLSTPLPTLPCAHAPCIHACPHTCIHAFI